MVVWGPAHRHLTPFQALKWGKVLLNRFPNPDLEALLQEPSKLTGSMLLPFHVKLEEAKAHVVETAKAKIESASRDPPRFVGPIHFEDLRGKIFTIDGINLNDTGHTLRERYQDFSGVPPSQQILFWAGRIIAPDDVLREHNLVKDSTIHVKLKLRGGMFHITTDSTAQSSVQGCIEIHIGRDAQHQVVTVGSPVTTSVQEINEALVMHCVATNISLPESYCLEETMPLKYIDGVSFDVTRQRVGFCVVPT